MNRIIKKKGIDVNIQIITDAIVFVPEKDNVIKKFIKVRTLWDTGATHSQITREVAEVLGLKPIETLPVNHGAGQSEMRIYEAGLAVDDVIRVKQMKMAECYGAGRFDAIIGMDIISFGTFRLEGVGEERTFTFEITER